jgi:hypothetical protein
MRSSISHFGRACGANGAGVEKGERVLLHDHHLLHITIAIPDSFSRGQVRFHRLAVNPPCILFFVLSVDERS